MEYSLSVLIASDKILIRFLQNELVLLKILRKKRASERLLSWDPAIYAFDDSLLRRYAIVSYTPLEFQFRRCRSFPRLSESELSCIIAYLDNSSLSKTHATCVRMYAAISTSMVWASRPLDLTHIKSRRQWEQALRIHARSKHWSYCTEVKAPRAKSIHVASEVLSFFGRRLKHLDLREADSAALLDYCFMIPLRFRANRLHMDRLTLPSERSSRLDRQSCIEEYVVRRTLRKVSFISGIKGVDEIVWT
jgi:hypothetical protein